MYSILKQNIGPNPICHVFRQYSHLSNIYCFIGNFTQKSLSTHLTLKSPRREIISEMVPKIQNYFTQGTIYAFEMSNMQPVTTHLNPTWKSLFNRFLYPSPTLLSLNSKPSLGLILCSFPNPK